MIGMEKSFILNCGSDIRSFPKHTFSPPILSYIRPTSFTQIRTHAGQAGGRGFESRRSRQIFDPNTLSSVETYRGSITSALSTTRPESAQHPGLATFDEHDQAVINRFLWDSAQGALGCLI